MVAKISQFRKKRRSSVRSAVLGWTFLAAIFIFGIFLIFHNIRIYQKRTELRQRGQELQAEIAQLAAKEQKLKAQIEETSTESYQEKILREQGLYKKPGEEVVTILPPEDSQQEEGGGTKRVWWNPFTWFQ
tara:strand:- start:8180 stop:8572 length:393 start_codon:yes stop_codon:yes gene_type:complete